VRNWIDAGELAAVWAGPRRVRVRESDLDSFLAESAIRRERLEEGDLWAKVGEAAKAVASAVRGQDREALDRRDRETGGRRSGDPLGLGQHSHLIPRPPLNLR
jgi:hypothetical protein